MQVKKKIVGSGELDLLIKEGRWEEVIDARTRRVKWLYENSNKTAMVIDETLVRLMVQSLRKKIMDLENPQAIKDPSSTYDKKMGDDKICQCGHSYFQHFDSFENMRHIGCKYCECYDFKEKISEPTDLSSE